MFCSVTDRPAPRPLSVPPIEYSLTHVTVTLVMFVDPTEPEPFVTVHAWPVGWALTDTA